MNSLLYLTVISPICLATAMAFGDGVHNFQIAGICLLIMCFFQFFINKILMMLNALKTLKTFIFLYLLIFFFYGLIPVSLCYYWQSFEINLAIVLSGLTPGLFAIAIFSTYQLSQTPQSDPKTISQKEQIYKSIIMSSTVVGLLMPVVIYLLIADHKGILICSFLIIVATPYLFNLFINNTRKFDDLIFFNKFLITAYLFFFAIGWIF